MMSTGTRFQLKQPTGCFAAGREVACALQLLSDAAFKLFLWLCLHAERGRGAVSATPTELAKAVGQKESDIAVAIEELEQQGVCKLRPDGVIEIQDRFWPYQRKCGSTVNPESRRYVAEVKRLFLERRCVQSSFTAADEKLALSLFRRGVSLIQIERAILLGSLRKYISALQNAVSTPISSLHYFTNLFEEVQQELSAQYWTYIAQKVKTFEQAWRGFHATGCGEHAQSGQNRGMLEVD
jgi:helix-turn-helix protein